MGNRPDVTSGRKVRAPQEQDSGKQPPSIIAEVLVRKKFLQEARESATETIPPRCHIGVRMKSEELRLFSSCW